MTSDPPQSSSESSPGVGGDASAGWLQRMFRGRSGKDMGTEGYRRLAIQLDLDLEGTERGLSVMLASPTSRQVADEAGVELAYVLAEEMGRNVLLVDGTFTEGAVSKAFGHQDTTGLVDLLRNGTENIKPILCPTAHKRIFLLPAGRHAETASLQRQRLKLILDQACAEFDYVLIPVQPILQNSKGLVFPALVDQVLMLIVEGRTLVDKLDAARQVLEDCGAHRVGLVLTKPARRRLTSR